MSRNGSGTYSLPAGNPVVTGTTISSTVQNTTMSDVATALTASIANDGQTPITANLPMATFRHTGVGNAVARTDYAAAGQVQDGSFIYVATVGGTADTITLTPAPAITSYVAGRRFVFIASGTNTTSVSVNASGLGARALNKFGSTPLVAGDIPSGAIVEIVDDGTQFQIVGHLLQLLSRANTFIATQTFTHEINQAQGTNIASATNIDIGAATGNYILVTGTTTIQSLGTIQAGTQRTVTFTGALTLTYNGTSLILPTSGNITTAAGDSADFISLGSGNWRCTNYQTSAAVPLAAVQSDQETATSVARFVSPGTQQYHPSTVKAWVKAGIDGSIAASYNVASLTDDGVGLITVTFTTSFSSANYCISTGLFVSAAGTNYVSVVSAQSAGSFSAKCRDNTATLADPTNWFFSCMGDQ